MPEEITALSIAHQLEGLYTDFTDSVRDMGSKTSGKKGKSKLGYSVVHWLAGSHVKTERDVLCEKFLQDVEALFVTFDYALEGISEEEAQEACGVVARTMSEPVPAQSNSTTNLMRRAMIGHLQPYLPRLSNQQLTELKQRIEEAYSRSQRLPVEREVLKSIDRLLK